MRVGRRVREEGEKEGRERGRVREEGEERGKGEREGERRERMGRIGEEGQTKCERMDDDEGKAGVWLVD